MKVLVACEESQRVCEAFRKKGHEAYSCDIQDQSGGHPEWHIYQDVLPLINGNCTFKTTDGVEHTIEGKWDLLIAHPPCTYLSNAGNKYFDVEKYGDKALKRIENREKAVKFFMEFINADCDKIAVENPVGYMNTHFRKPEQIIHPYYFAKDENDEENYQLKKTCLWLKNLKPLVKTNNLGKPAPYYKDGRGVGRHFTDAMCDKKKRSKTFYAIAEAMADQWG